MANHIHTNQVIRQTGYEDIRVAMYSNGYVHLRQVDDLLILEPETVKQLITLLSAPVIPL